MPLADWGVHLPKIGMIAGAAMAEFLHKSLGFGRVPVKESDGQLVELNMLGWRDSQNHSEMCCLLLCSRSMRRESVHNL